MVENHLVLGSTLLDSVWILMERSGRHEFRSMLEDSNVELLDSFSLNHLLLYLWKGQLKNGGRVESDC